MFTDSLPSGMSSLVEKSNLSPVFILSMRHFPTQSDDLDNCCVYGMQINMQVLNLLISTFSYLYSSIILLYAVRSV